MKTKAITRSLIALLFIFLCASVSPAFAQLAGKKVVIDPGHGGTDPGAVGVDGGAYPNEEDFNLIQALQIRTMLQNAGCTVVMTRTTDATVSLTARRDLINSQNPNCAFSIHHNSFGEASAHGTETFWHTSGNAADQNMASKVQTRLLQYLGRFNRGVKQGNFTVITANPPVCLGENLFLSNPTEFNIINSTAGNQNAATAYYMAVGDFLGINLDTPVNNASVVSMSYPASVTAGQVFSGTITMRNNGTKVWNNDATPHRLGSQNPQDNTRWGTGRVNLPSSPINPNQNAAFTFNFTAPTTPGTYAFDWKMVEDGVQWFGATAVGSITVNPAVTPPSITTQPASQTKNAGESVTFTVTATGSAPLSYQWRKDAVNISGANASSYTRSNLQFGDSGNYSVVVSNPGGSTTSANAVLTVNSAPVITAQPQSQTVAPGANVTLSVSVSGSAPLSYQWSFNGAAISGATTSSLVRNNVQAANIGYYSVFVSNPFGSVTSSTATLSLNSAVVFNETFESGNLNNWAINSGSTTLAISTAQNHTSPGANSALVTSSANKMYHNLGSEVEGRARVTFWIYDDSGTQTRAFGEVRSYTGAGYPNGGLDQLFAIGRYTVGFGTGTGTLAGEVVNTAKYQGRVVSGANTGWFNLNANRSTGWHKFEIERASNGTTINFYVDSVLDRTITAASFATWDSVHIGSLGSGTTVGNAWFDDIKVEYLDAPTITTQPASQSVNSGNTVTFSVGSTPNISSYQWRKNGVNISGATAATLVLNNAQQSDSGTYSVIVRNGIGIATSANATLTVTDVAPSITTQPQSQTLFIGENATFTVVASGSAPLTYQWRKNTVNISGATSSSYVKNNIQSADAGNYSVVVGNFLGNVTSADTVLTVIGNSAPVLGSIGNRTVNEGTALTFTATATDADAGDTLTFSLDAGAPSGASINSNGAFSWTPTETQGPGVYSITVRVTDNGSPVLDDSETISVTVNEANVAPVLSLGAARVTETFAHFETFADGFGNDLVMFRKPSNSSTTSGFLDAAPNTTLVTASFPAGHSSAKVLKASFSFATGTTNPWLRLTSFNSANLPNPTIDFGQTVRFDIYTDKNLKVGLGLRESATSAAIGANGGTTGAIEFVGVPTKTGSMPNPSRTVTAGSWVTLEFTLPSEPAISFNAGDGVLASGKGVLEHLALVPAGGMGAYNVYLDNFQVVYTQSMPSTINMNSDSILSFTASANDSDLPAQTLSFSLDAGAPAGASINSGNGAFSWTPTSGQAGTHNLTVRATDNGPGNLSDAEPFTVIVTADPMAPLSSNSEGAVASGEIVSLSWGAVPGQKYLVQYKDSLSADWTTLQEITASSESESIAVENGDAERFYRIVLADDTGAASE